MAIEIERKFLVSGNQWRGLAISRTTIRQAYLAAGARSSTRVRIKDDKSATLTIKSKRAELQRVEIEYPISIDDAEVLLSLRESSLIHKIRHAVPWGDGHVWEVDEFLGDNAGLLIAEIELGSAQERFDRPTWLGVEVTGRPQYYNSALAKHPYNRWAEAPAVFATA